MGSITEGFKSMSDSILTARIKKFELEKEKSEKQSNLVALKETGLSLADKMKQSGADPAIADTFAEAITGQTDPDVAKSLVTAGLSSFTAQMKDKNDFTQAMQMEKYKAGTAAVTEVVKSMAERGGFSPEQLQAIQAESADRVYQSLGVGDIANKIKQSTLASQNNGSESEQTSDDFFSKPIPAKQSEKQRDFQDTLDHGLNILDETEKQYNFISEKYGTGRIKGIATTLLGKAGDLLDPSRQAPEVVPYLNNLEGLANFIGKSLYRDERVSDVNIEGYKKALAELTNTPAEAKIMFNTLRKYGKNPGDIKTEMAIRSMLPKDNSKGMEPSSAASKAGLLKVAANKKTGEKLYQDSESGKWLPLK